MQHHQESENNFFYYLDQACHNHPNPFHYKQKILNQILPHDPLKQKQYLYQIPYGH